MKAATAQFERELATERAALTANLRTLEERAHALVDWRQRIRRQPLEAVGVALAGGVLLALLTEQRPRRRTAAATDEDGGSGAPHPVLERLVAAFAAVAAERALAALGMPPSPAAGTSHRDRPASSDDVGP